MAIGASASVSGIALIGFMVGATLGSLLTGRLLTRLTHYMRVPIGGLVVAIATLIALAVYSGQLSLGAFTLLLMVLGAAIGPMYQTSTIVMQNAVKLHQMGTATGALNFFRLLGGALVVAVFGAIVLGGSGEQFGSSSLNGLGVHPAEVAIAFRFVFLAAAAFLAIALACLFAVEERPLHGPARLVESGMD
jgi:MFS family permease